MRKIRKNLGVLNHAIPIDSMMIMEGARHNLFSGKPFNTEVNEPKLSNAVSKGPYYHRMFFQLEEGLQAFQVKRGEEFEFQVRAKCIDENLEYTFSAYIITTHATPVLLRVEVSSNTENKCDNLLISNELNRFEVPYEVSVSPEVISVSIKGLIPEEEGGSEDPIIAFAFFCVEEGLFASSPILGSYRDGDQLSLQKEDNFPDTNAGMVFLSFVPDWGGSQLGKEWSAYLFDITSSDFSNSISIYVDATESGRICAEVVVKNCKYKILTDITPVKGAFYAVSLRWRPSMMELDINGRTAGWLVINETPDFESLGRIYIGSTSRSKYLSLFGKLADIEIYDKWASVNQLQAHLYSKYPSIYPHFLQPWLVINSPPLVKHFKSDSWYYEVSQCFLDLNRIWQETPPKWLLSTKIDEADCRDEIQRYFQIRNVSQDAIPEFHSFEGRSDLYIRERAEPRRVLRVEFKVWGRHDYKEVPKKPLKYFTDGDETGVVLMINPNKTKLIDAEYRQNVSLSQTGFKSLIETPFGSEYASHFISSHSSERVSHIEILHIILNRQGPFASKDI